MSIRSIYPNVPGASADLRKRFNRTFSPLHIQLTADTVRTISILWSSTTDASHSTNGIWLPDCVVPLLLKPDVYK